MSFFLLAQQHGGPGIDPMHPEHANYAAAFWTLGIFVVLLALLGKFAWGPIVKGLHAREEKINASLTRAEEVEKATRELQATIEAARAKAHQEAQGIVAEARAAAQKAAAEVSAKAQAEIHAAKDRYQRELGLEADKVRSELRRDAVDLVVSATAKLIGRSLSAQDQQRLAEEALRDAEKVARN